MTAETDGYDPSSARLRHYRSNYSCWASNIGMGTKEKFMRPTTLWRQPGLMNKGGQACMGRRQYPPGQLLEQRPIWRGARSIAFRSLTQGRRATYARPSF